ncbi:MAG: hypothetical protein JWQ35_2733 [Bacteriovoracaceae bacterium]|nr:hypothetical protein [Bacteriovoracaceae bacterium]
MIGSIFFIALCSLPDLNEFVGAYKVVEYPKQARRYIAELTLSDVFMAQLDLAHLKRYDLTLWDGPEPSGFAMSLLKHTKSGLWFSLHPAVAKSEINSLSESDLEAFFLPAETTENSWTMNYTDRFTHRNDRKLCLSVLADGRLRFDNSRYDLASYPANFPIPMTYVLQRSAVLNPHRLRDLHRRRLSQVLE